MRSPESVPVLVAQLGNRSPLVSGAAYSALVAFMHPLPTEAEFDAFMLRLLEEPDDFEGAVLDRIIEFIRREVPKRAPYDKLFDRQIAACVEDEELAHRLRGAAYNEPEPPPGKVDDEPILASEPVPLDDERQPPAPPQPGSAWTQELERRRAAFRAARSPGQLMEPIEQSRPRSRRAAFTLIEMLIVVAIIAILAAVAVPNMLDAQVRARVSRAGATCARSPPPSRSTVSTTTLPDDDRGRIFRGVAPLAGSDLSGGMSPMP